MTTVEWQYRAIRTAYFIRIPNVGDAVNPSLVNAITGQAVCHIGGQGGPHLLAIGSLMAGATPSSQVWGTGVMHPDLGIGDVPVSNIHALRGELSRTAMRQSGVLVGDVPLGDPGYLAPRLLGFERSVVPKSRVGLVPHYVDRRHPIVQSLLKQPGVVDLNVHEPPEVFLSRMAECETVVSTSLHGLIFAEALGIPNLWATVSDEIAGGDFKFRDWFSTMGRPQQAPHRLASSDSSKELATRAQLHDSKIDVGALIDAFPHHRVEELQLPAGRRTMPINACRSHPTPVFLISFNRGVELKRSVEGIRGLRRPTKIIVHDNGSTDPHTHAALNELELEGIKIFRRAAISSPDELNQVDDTIQAYFAEWAEPARYVVSDCDIDLSIADPTALDVYDELLNTHRRAECVGPMLRIRDIPSAYRMFNRVMNRHIKQFWRHSPELVETSWGEVALQKCSIDTTFALHRAGESFRRLKSGLRVYEPFEALHLDWYRTCSSDDIYSETSNDSISHWNNSAEFSRYQDDALEYSEFCAVRKTERSNGLEVYIEHLPFVSSALPGEVMPTAATVVPGIPSFSSATAAQRSARIAHIENLRLARASESARWIQSYNHSEDWSSRSIALAGLIEPGERVFEFGAGRSAVPGALPTGCRYTASDLAPLASNIMFYDLNALTLLPIVNHDVALLSGVIEYVHDLERATLFLANNFSSVLCSYAICGDGLPEEIEHRRYSGWFTDLTEAELITLFEAAGFTLSNSDSWGSQKLFRFDKRSDR